MPRPQDHKPARPQDRKAAALPTASAAGAGRRPAYPCAGLSARTRTPSQAPLGWGRVPPCTGPRQAGLPKLTFKTVLLITSLPRKGIDKEAGRSARTPAPEVALLLPARAQSGAPLRAPLPVCSGLASACILQRGRPLTPKPPLPMLMRKGRRMPRGKGAQGKGRLVRASADGWLRKVKVVRGVPLTLPQGLHKIYQVGIYQGGEKPSPLIPSEIVGINCCECLEKRSKKC